MKKAEQTLQLLEKAKEIAKEKQNTIEGILNYVSKIDEINEKMEKLRKERQYYVKKLQNNISGIKEKEVLLVLPMPHIRSILNKYAIKKPKKKSK